MDITAIAAIEQVREDGHVDQAMAAMLGGIAGSLGAAGAAILAGWSQRRQARIAATMQYAQWRSQLRRETYGRYLTTAAEAREELSVLWHLLNDASTKIAIEDVNRLMEARTSVWAVQRAKADIALEGPVDVLAAADDIEKNVELLYAQLRVWHSSLSGGDIKTTESHRRACDHQRIQVRKYISRFAQAARAVLDGTEKADGSGQRETIRGGGLEDAAWLTECLRSLGAVNVAGSIDLNLTLWEHGLSSLDIARFAGKARERYGTVSIPTLYKWGDITLAELVENLTALRQEQVGAPSPSVSVSGR
jgi:hypothetical protein